MLKGRLGLEKARIPHADRHGLIYLDRGSLTARFGSLSFESRPHEEIMEDGLYIPSGEYNIPFQGLSMILLGPGSMVSHDALRLLARHGTGLVAVGADGVRCYTAPPIFSDQSRLARKQVQLWADPDERLEIAKKMYAIRMGESVIGLSIEELRGIEGARVKRSYQVHANQVGISWSKRRVDRTNPGSTDLPNKAIDHASTAVKGAAMIAVTATSCIPQLGFIHEASGSAFILDIADLFREEITLPVAFQSTKKVIQSHGRLSIERETRKRCGRVLRKEQVIPRMIDRIKEFLE